MSYKFATFELKKAVNLIFEKMFYIEYSALYILTYPVRIVIKFISAMISPIYKKIKLKAKSRRFNSQMKKKSTEQALILKNIQINAY